MMKLKKILFYFFTILAFTQCNNNDNDCLFPDFEKSIKDYINEYEVVSTFNNGASIDSNFNYFCVYFHNQKGNTYFTICQSPLPGYVLFPEVKQEANSINHLLFSISNRYVSIIADKSISLDGFIYNCNENGSLSVNEKDSASLPVYDGSYYPVTYQYSNTNDDIVISKLNDPILDFNPEWKRYEEFHNRKKRTAE